MAATPQHSPGGVELTLLRLELIQVAANYNHNLALMCLTLTHMNHAPYHRALHTTCVRAAHEIHTFLTLLAQTLISRVFSTLIVRCS